MEVKQRIPNKPEYYVRCVHCNQEIKGTNRDQVLWNLSVHLNAKHKDKISKTTKELDGRSASKPDVAAPDALQSGEQDNGTTN